MSLKDRTLSRMAELGIAPKRSLGQNFLISETVVEKIISAVERLRSDLRIEVGPGLGALTDRLRELGPLQLVELDKTFADYWRKQDLQVVEADALKADWSQLLSQGSVSLVSNLPYQISSRLVVELSFVMPHPTAMVFMFQKEVAQRLTARPSTEDYGLLSVIAQSYWEMSTVTNAGMQDFYPAPQVGSRVVQFKWKKGAPRQDLRFLEFCKAAFAQRRKFLVKNLAGYGVDWQSRFTELGLRADIRAEALTPEQFWKLFEALK